MSEREKTPVVRGWLGAGTGCIGGVVEFPSSETFETQLDAVLGKLVLLGARGGLQRSPPASAAL